MAANVSKVLTLNSLQSSTAYQISGYCQTQGAVQTNLTTLIQSTNSNGGIVSMMNFYFSSALTTAQKIKLVCALALYFGIDYTKVSTWDGYYCSELLNRRRLLHEDIKDKHEDTKDKHKDTKDKHEDTKDKHEDIKDKHEDIKDNQING
jgi:hypothetical protein